MKAKLNQQGRVIDRRSDNDPLVDETFVDCPHYALPGSTWDGEQWLHPSGRPFNDAEMQTVETPLSFIGRLTDTELVALEDLCIAGPYRATAIRIRNALLAAGEIESRNPQTKQLMQAAIAFGILTVARAREILGDVDAV